ncbi:MAG TPA: hypothetical protein VMJ90_06030 [Anaerolineales bacterium]|nr:hypothetical protein [Anaerolineales bacterium]
MSFILFLWVFSAIKVSSALIGGFVLHLPVYYVFALVLLEEIAKAIIIFRRHLPRKWINDPVNVTGDGAPASSNPAPVP